MTDDSGLLAVLQRFMESRPLCVMARCIMGYVLSSKIDEVFQECRQRQYEAELKFSVLAASIGDVAMKFCDNFHQAYGTHHKDLQVSAPAFYGKLNRVETPVAEGIVDFSAQKSRELLDEIGAGNRLVLKGYKCSTIDGNHLQKTEKRIGELRGLCAAALPGTAVAKFNLHNQLFERAYLLADAHAQESSVLDRVVADLEHKELLIADRHFCIVNFMRRVAERRSCFLIRQHGRLKGQLLGTRKQIGRIPSGMVYEQAMQITDGDQTLTIRRITLELDQPTRDGDLQIHILSNVPSKDATACELA
ncbi:MAG TPA: transposase, partial [Pirellula sp.]|nr:transposase [Pirellula sp.]